jgi:hypothetical protein
MQGTYREFVRSLLALHMYKSHFLLGPSCREASTTGGDDYEQGKSRLDETSCYIQIQIEGALFTAQALSAQAQGLEYCSTMIAALFPALCRHSV